jgi:hypothetical protein
MYAVGTALLNKIKKNNNMKSSTRRVAVLTGVLHGFPQSLQANAGAVPHIRS